MKKIVIFVHGILARDRGAKFERFAPAFEERGYGVDIFSWGFGFLLRPLAGWLVRRQEERVARLVREYHARGCAVVCAGHSHGAAILCRASRSPGGFPADVVALVNAALDRDARFGPDVGVVLNYYAPGDPVLRLANVFGTGWDWGTAGKRGWKISAMAADERLWQVNMGQAFGIRGHGEVFEPSRAAVVSAHLALAADYYLAWLRGPAAEA